MLTQKTLSWNSYIHKRCLCKFTLTQKSPLWNSYLHKRCLTCRQHCSPLSSTCSSTESASFITLRLHTSRSAHCRQSAHHKFSLLLASLAQPAAKRAYIQCRSLPVWSSISLLLALLSDNLYMLASRASLYYHSLLVHYQFSLLLTQPAASAALHCPLPTHYQFSLLLMFCCLHH